MGITLEKSHIAEDLLESLSDLLWRLKGGLGIAVMIIGMLLAASTGIVGATVVRSPKYLERGSDLKWFDGNGDPSC